MDFLSRVIHAIILAALEILFPSQIPCHALLGTYAAFKVMNQAGIMWVAIVPKQVSFTAALRYFL